MDITSALLHVARRDLLMSWAQEAEKEVNGRQEALRASTCKAYIVDIFKYWHHYESESQERVDRYGDWNYDSTIYRPLKRLLETMRRDESGLMGAEIPLHLGPGDNIDSSILSKMDHQERVIFPEQV